MERPFKSRLHHDSLDRVTKSTPRDWQIFMSIIDDKSAKPSQALIEAAKRYQRQARKRRKS